MTIFQNRLSIWLDLLKKLLLKLKSCLKNMPKLDYCICMYSFKLVIHVDFVCVYKKKSLIQTHGSRFFTFTGEN